LDLLTSDCSRNNGKLHAVGGIGPLEHVSAPASHLLPYRVASSSVVKDGPYFLPPCLSVYARGWTDIVPLAMIRGCSKLTKTMTETVESKPQEKAN
jgi:hypothetical protein